jgi:organic hydroperoxide reductase OsmC/OhrA
MTTTTTTESTILNGVDAGALRAAVDTIAQDPSHAKTHWQVATHWRGGFRSDTRATQYTIGGQRIAKDFTIRVDEPLELFGTNQYANPQEHLLAALNACMIVGYSALCALEGIELEQLCIETDGEIDLRGFLGIDPTVKPGYDQLRYTVRIKGNGTPEQFEKIHRAVMVTSPNYFNIANAIPLRSRLVVE